jgi:CRISPR-associated protein Csm4
MSNYVEYQITIMPQSPLITPLHSDTLFGHVCWAIRYLWGELKLKHFLEAFKDESEAPFLVSDGFPKDYLPKPVLTPLLLSSVNATIDKVNDLKNISLSTAQRTQILKNIKNQHVISYDIFKKIQANCSAENLLHQVLLDMITPEYPTGKIKSDTVSNVLTHNTVNRIYNTVIEGLFRQTENFFPDGFSFDVYLKTFYFSHPEIEQIFEFIKYSGFGKDKSTGKGKFAITIQSGSKLPVITNPNAFMILSHYVPNESAPTVGYYRVMTKYGRLGGDYANSVIPALKAKDKTARVHPFKKPITMVKPGAVFVGEPKLSYGILLGGANRPPIPNLSVHKFNDIRHYAYAYPLGLLVNKEEFSE